VASRARSTKNWGYIELLVDRGMSPEEILNRPLKVMKRNPDPTGQRPFTQNEG
jgi:hypothetical protein